MWHFLPGSVCSLLAYTPVAHSCLEAAERPDRERLPVNCMISLNMAVGSLSSQHAGRSSATPKPAPSPQEESQDHRKPTWAAEFRAGAEAVLKAGPVPGLDFPPGPSAALSLVPRLHLFPRVPRAAKCHQMGSLEPQNLSSPSSGSQNSKIKCGQATLPPKVPGSICPRPLSWLLVASGVPWLTDGCLLPTSLHTAFPLYLSVSVSKFPPFWTQLYWIRVHPNDLILTESSL